MIQNPSDTFEMLLNATELRKIDYKSKQYHLDNDVIKSHFVKDIICMANSPGEDGYILLGIKTEKGKPQQIIGIHHHHDSAELESIVNSKIQEPIHFDYYPLTYKGRECALIHIPPSKARPHWLLKDFGILRHHVFYTRRASGNREASLQEIREMLMQSMKISDIAQTKAKATGFVIDELMNMDIDDRRQAMYEMIKKAARRMRLKNYKLITGGYFSIPICALATGESMKGSNDYTIIAYPWTAKKSDISESQQQIIAASRQLRHSQLPIRIKTRLSNSIYVHIAYRDIQTKALERWSFSPIDGWFANAWKEPWGRIMKWEARRPDWKDGKFTFSHKEVYGFFLPNITSSIELQTNLEKVVSWVNNLDTNKT